MKNEKTSIAVSRSTKDMLDKIGAKGDTYDDIIRRLIELVAHYGNDNPAKKGE